MAGASASAKKVVPVYLEPELVEWLEEMAKRHDRTKGYFIRQAVTEFQAKVDPAAQELVAR